MRLRIVICLVALLWSAAPLRAADDGVQAWRATSGWTLWRHTAGGMPQWEIADVTGDGQVDIAIYRAGDKLARVEVDNDADGAADRIYLFDPSGQSNGYLDADGDGVLEPPPGDRGQRQAALHADGRDDEFFNRALTLRRRADAGKLTPTDVAAPEAWPAFRRGRAVPTALDVTMSLVPGGDAPTAFPTGLGRFSFRPGSGVGGAFEREIAVRADPTEQTPATPGRLWLMVFPVRIRSAQGDAGGESLMLQLVGRVSAPGVIDQPFFVMTTLDPTSTATLNVPVHDRAGRRSGSLLIEVRTEP